MRSLTSDGNSTGNDASMPRLQRSSSTGWYAAPNPSTKSRNGVSGNRSANAFAAAVPVTVKAALDADVIFLAVRFTHVQAVATKRPDWTGKIVVDVTNALQPAEQRETELRGLLSSEINAQFVSVTIRQEW